MQGPQGPPAEPLDEPPLEAVRTARAGGTDGHRPSMALLQLFQQGLPDAWNLVNMLMAVDEGRRLPEQLLEAVQLPADAVQNPGL